MWPEGLAKVEAMGSAAWMLPVGAFLAGVALQLLLSRKPAPPAAAPPVLPPLPPQSGPRA
jgi:hypothetical protein